MFKASAKTVSALRTMTFNQTMIRVKDQKKSMDFYRDVLGMTLIATRHFPQWTFSLYYLVSLPPGQTYTLSPESNEAQDYLKNGSYGCTLELTHNYGTESDDAFHYHNGNTEPLGFGHLGFLVHDVPAVVTSSKCKPLHVNDDGTTLATISDPDGYHVQLQASPKDGITFHHTMLRVSDMVKSKCYYQDLCGMTLVDEIQTEWMHECYFGTFPEGKGDVPPAGTAAATEFRISFPGTLLKLSADLSVSRDTVYHNGNSDPTGFGHIAFMVDDVFETSDALELDQVDFQKKPRDGKMNGLAFIKDPDTYWIELVPKNADITVNES